MIVNFGVINDPYFWKSTLKSPPSQGRQPFNKI